MKTSAEMMEEILVSACEAGSDASDPCLQAIRSHLAAGGGRVRARICHGAGLSLGMPERDALRISAVCELLHNASLIQDDLLDRSAVRRGAPCVWVTYGDAIAVCAGDLMLSSAYGLMAEIVDPHMLGPALRLVHMRAREVILGQALEGVAKTAQEPTEAYYSRLARAKSASLLSLSLELPLLLTGHHSHLDTAHAAACEFAVAYQISDDLADLAQDMQEGTVNLALLLIQHEGMTRADALIAAAGIARTKLAAAEEDASLLPGGCAATLLEYAHRLRHSLDMVPAPATAESQI